MKKTLSILALIAGVAVLVYVFFFRKPKEEEKILDTEAEPVNELGEWQGSEAVVLDGVQSEVIHYVEPVVDTGITRERPSSIATNLVTVASISGR